MALLAVVASAASCGGGGGKAAAQSGTYVGKVQGTNAYIALVSDQRAILGYVCDARKVSTWFGKRSLSDSSAKLASRHGTPLGEATLSGDRATGQVAIAGRRHAFSARLASGKAGLYREASADPGEPGFEKPGFRETGWIALPDGSVRGRTNLISMLGMFETTSAPSSPIGKPVSSELVWPEQERYREARGGD